ncbi:HlyD family secretion protein [Hellea balneolensis]|uniref:HlyD family secretion protein n=1 Tax=Hellea balneolensis TaxID=287478 RepID=UPI0003FE87A3|nr:HlyD family efflux transporter periplasmic adaptor subunit [Hellea balneolensis]
MSLFRKEALEYKRRKLHGEVILVQPVGFLIMTVVFFAVTLGLVGFLLNGEYKRKETVVGYLAPANGLSIIRADQGGRLTQVFVNEGDYVEAGAPLFESRVDVETEGGFIGERRLESTDVRLSELREQLINTQKRFAGDRARLTSQALNYERELDGLLRRRVLQNQAVELAAAQFEKIERLTAQEVTSQLELDNARSNDINQRLALESIDQQIVSREGTLSEVRFAISGLKANEDRELSQTRVQISQLEESRASLEASSSYMVRSPIAGTVTALQGMAGQTVPPNAPLVMIIPEGSGLQATLLAPTRSAGFLKAGQDVNLLVDAFPYQKFGVQHGIIKEISATPYRPGELDAPIPYEQAVYRVVVDLNKQTVSAYGNEVDLKAGMTLQGDLITDRRTLMQWMLDPLMTMKRS